MTLNDTHCLPSPTLSSSRECRVDMDMSAEDMTMIMMTTTARKVKKVGDDRCLRTVFAELDRRMACHVIVCLRVWTVEWEWLMTRRTHPYSLLIIRRTVNKQKNRCHFLRPLIISEIQNVVHRKTPEEEEEEATLWLTSNVPFIHPRMSECRELHVHFPHDQNSWASQESLWKAKDGIKNRCVKIQVPLTLSPSGWMTIEWGENGDLVDVHDAREIMGVNNDPSIKLSASGGDRSWRTIYSPRDGETSFAKKNKKRRQWLSRTRSQFPLAIFGVRGK